MQAKTRGLDPGTGGKKLRKGDTHKGRGDGDTDKTTDSHKHHRDETRTREEFHIQETMTWKYKQTH